MGRRGNGKGTITRRKDGRWEARYYFQTANGTKRKVLYGKTRAEARDKLAKALSDRIDGIVYDDEKGSFSPQISSVGTWTDRSSSRTSSARRSRAVRQRVVGPLLMAS